MFHLVNKFGNVHKHVKDARKRDELIANGYKLVEGETESPLSPVRGELPQSPPAAVPAPSEREPRAVVGARPYEAAAGVNVEGAKVDDDLGANANVEGERGVEDVAPYDGPQDATHVEGAIEGEQKPKKAKAKKAAEE